MNEFIIGEEFEILGMRFKCVEEIESLCHKCAFVYNNMSCEYINCAAHARQDGKNVYFIKI
jgi:hypothetical protein